MNRLEDIKRLVLVLADFQDFLAKWEERDQDFSPSFLVQRVLVGFHHTLQGIDCLWDKLPQYRTQIGRIEAIMKEGEEKLIVLLKKYGHEVNAYLRSEEILGHLASLEEDLRSIRDSAENQILLDEDSEQREESRHDLDEKVGSFLFEFSEYYHVLMSLDYLDFSADAKAFQDAFKRVESRFVRLHPYLRESAHLLEMMEQSEFYAPLWWLNTPSDPAARMGEWFDFLLQFAPWEELKPEAAFTMSEALSPTIIVKREESAEQGKELIAGVSNAILDEPGRRSFVVPLEDEQELIGIASKMRAEQLFSAVIYDAANRTADLIVDNFAKLKKYLTRETIFSLMPLLRLSQYRTIESIFQDVQEQIPSWHKMNSGVRRALKLPSKARVESLLKIYSQFEDGYVAFNLAWALFLAGNYDQARLFASFAGEKLPRPEWKQFAEDLQTIIAIKSQGSPLTPDKQVIVSVWEAKMQYGDVWVFDSLGKIFRETQNGYAAYELAREYRYAGQYKKAKEWAKLAEANFEDTVWKAWARRTSKEVLELKEVERGDFLYETQFVSIPQLQMARG